MQQRTRVSQVVHDRRFRRRDPTSKDKSGRGDLNPRPPAPKAGALPGCATPRSTRTILAAPIGYRIDGRRRPLGEKTRTERSVFGWIDRVEITAGKRAQLLEWIPGESG